nr:T9SS type A sorting domain-containing protein [Bacteroidales bacterium]
PKFQLRETSTKVYIPVEGKDYAVVRSENQGEMPVSFKAEHNGSYTISVEAVNIDMQYLHLIDNMTGADIDLLAQPSYSFEARTTDYASRFKLVFATGNSNEGDNIGFINGNLVVFGIEGEATLQVIDILGHVLISETFSGSYNRHLDVIPGVYMVRVTDGQGQTCCGKIVVN